MSAETAPLLVDLELTVNGRRLSRRIPTTMRLLHFLSA